MFRRLFGRLGPSVTLVGLGGEGVLRTYGRDSEARGVIEEAARQGINYFDSARAYAGSEGYFGSFWREHPALREGTFQTSKSAARGREGALRDLTLTLETMGCRYLDLWQIHDLRTVRDLEAVEAPGGALEAFLQARETGLTRYVGVTGHHDPAVLERAVSSWPVDAVLIPVNPVEAALGGFLDRVLGAAQERGMAVIGMKVLGGSHYFSPNAGIAPGKLIRFALSQDIATAIVGCSTPAEVQSLAHAGRDFQPISQEEQEALVRIFRPHARRLAYYRGGLY
jgi:aryl-alcohol dehydrogenase-like predicted oxidoreductase